uniref:multidrug efflux MFS transporter EmrD n=1 Tax=Thaumasiovibrio occultus TaxID=1891184 RepID=UPI00192D173A|nr:multidrug efflux MFS transporter EmrD [Thaumasiovibrio occultus]
MHTTQNMSKLLFLVILMAGVGQMTQTMYVPAIGDMAESFGVRAGELQAVMAAYLTAYGLTQFIYGPLSDRFGRKPVLMAGMSIYLLGSAFALWAPTLSLFLIASFIQGAGTGCCGAMCRTIPRDCYEGDDLQRANSLVSMGIIFSPLLAPVLGGWMTTTFGWTAIYQFLALLGLAVTLILMTMLGETLPVEQRTTQPVAARYKEVLSNKGFQGHIVCLVATFSGIAIYEAAAGVLFGGVLGLSPSVVSILFILPLPGYLIGSWSSQTLVRRFGRHTSLLIGMGTLFAGALTILLAGLALSANAASLVIGGVLYFYGAGLVFPIATTAALTPFPRLAGTAGAVMGGMQNLGAGLTTLMVATLPAKDQISLGAALMVMASIAIVGMIRVQRTHPPLAVAS